MSELGDFLKKKREEQGLTLRDILKATAIREHYIELLERGSFEMLPSYVHVHGFVQQYSKALGLNFYEDIKPMLDKECAKEKFGKSQEEISIDGDAAKPGSFQIPLPQIIGGIVVLVIIVLMVVLIRSGGFSSKSASSRAVVESMRTVQVPVEDVKVEQPEEALPAQMEAPAIVDNMTQPLPAAVPAAAGAPTAPQTATTPSAATPATPATPPAAAPTTPPQRQVADLKFKDKCWIYFMADGDNTTAREFTANAGMTLRVYFDKYFMVHVGNAAALDVVYKDQSYTNLGDPDRAIHNLFFSANPAGRITMSRNTPEVAQ